MANRVIQGKVVKNQNDKSIVVEVEFTKPHKLYKKYLKLVKKYHVHDENNKYKVGDVVKIKSCRPVSKMKKWIVCDSSEKEGLKK